MSGYTKLFSLILASTVWREDNVTRIVWITLLAMADKNGVAEGSIPGLADFARVSVKDAESALLTLSSPDEYSRSKEHEGRRICEIDGGWQILNHAKYRSKMSADERREYQRLKQAEYRRRNSASTNVDNVPLASTQLTHTEAEAKADTKAKSREEQKTAAAVPEIPGNSRNGSAPLLTSPAEYHRRLIHCAFVGSRLEVPKSLHAELRKNLGGADPDAALAKWYLSLNDEIDQSGEAIAPDVFRWLKSRFAGWVKDSAKDAAHASLMERLGKIERGEIKR